MEAMQNVPAELRRTVAELAAEIVRLASALGSERWGITDRGNGFRLNVGWTEILTVCEDHLRLVVGSQVNEAHVANHVLLVDGDTERGFYPSVPGSRLAEVPFEPSDQFAPAIEALRPALTDAINLAARRRVGRGVRSGHSNAIVQQLEHFVGHTLPNPHYLSDKEEEKYGAALMEGALVRVLASKYERDQLARRKCIEFHGTSCSVCGFSFEFAFGTLGRGFIHVHHLIPLSSIGTEYEVDPVNDLRPVCPNCHAMLHREDPPISIESLRGLLGRENET